MYVVATAGHVDHGKSTLVKAMTGMEPDRWEQERRRGMTIDLGYAWTTLPGGRTVAFVDVPGHERFVPNMLAGVGPVPAALFVVAADGGWMPQSAEHLAALHALGVRHALVVVTRADLADPGPATAQARAALAGTSLDQAQPAFVAVSAVTGAGLDALRDALDGLLADLPGPDRHAPVRLWVDRSFSIRGAGTVVTGTLGAGTVGPDTEFDLIGAVGPGVTRVRVRGVQALGERVTRAEAVARVAVNLRGVDRSRVRRGDALVTPGRFECTDEIDVRVHGDPAPALPQALTLHVGAAAVPVRVRPLGPDVARLRLARRLPLRLGDRVLLRDPGSHRIPGGATVLDVVPPPLRRRGAAAARAGELSTMDGTPDVRGELARRGLVRRADLTRMGVPTTGATGAIGAEAPAGATGAEVPAVAAVAGDWLADPDRWAALRRSLAAEVARYAQRNPLEQGAPVAYLGQALNLPDRALVSALVAPPLVERSGRVAPQGTDPELPAALARAVAAVRTDLSADPFAAPDAGRLAALGLGARELAAAVRSGALLRVADGIVLLPDAVERAARVLGGLAQPFTLSQARQALGTTRRVAVPLLELLDRRQVTRRLPDDRRTTLT